MPVNKDINILIADDSPVHLDALKTALAQLGFKNVKAVTNGAEVETLLMLQMLESDNYDLVISDLEMPEMDGIELLQSVRATQEGIKFILLTSKDSYDFVIKAAEAKVDAYLIKPVNKETLIAKIEQLFAS